MRRGYRGKREGGGKEEQGRERREKERGGNNRMKEGVWGGGTLWRCKMGRPCRTCSPDAANIPPPLWPRFSLGEGAAAAGEHLLPRCNCFPAVAAPHVADPPPPLPPAASAPLPPRCRFDSPAAGARRPRRGLGKAGGERRSK